MEKITYFFSKPKNVYVSIITMLTLVVGLMTVSFSYYVDDSTNNTKLVSLSKVNNILQCDSLHDGMLVLEPGAEATLTVYVMSNNSFDSMYKLYYQARNSLVKVTSDKSVKNKIDSYDVHKYELKVVNNATTTQEIEIGIANGYLDKEVIMPEYAYEIK